MDRRGFTLLELTLSLSIALPLCAAFAFSLHSALSLLKSTSIERQDSYVITRTKALLNTVMQDMDTHRFAIAPRIHSSGLINFFDGTANPISGASGTRAPLSGSQAISGLSVDLLQAHRVREAVKGAAAYIYTACPQFFELENGTDERSFVGVYTSGLMELVGVSSALRAAGNCREFTLTPAQSMSLSNQHPEYGEYVRVLIPVRSQYTLYVDRNHYLRYLSHRGSRNIENQPLLFGLRSMELNLELLLDGKMYRLSAELVTTSGRDEQFSMMQQLGRTSQLNLLLNEWN